MRHRRAARAGPLCKIAARKRPFLEQSPTESLLPVHWALTLGSVDQAANGVGWTYSVNDSALDFLAAGETRIQVYTITINDGHTGGNVTQTVTLTLTITGPTMRRC
jgi:VCBS repeat-containing protein